MTPALRLENRLAELMMQDLIACDLGDGVEVVHDVEALEVEMECDLEDDMPVFTAETEQVLRVWLEGDPDAATRPFVRPARRRPRSVAQG